MNGYKILKCFRKEKRVSGKLPCPATGLIMPTGHIGFRLSVHACIRSSRTVHARVLKFHIWVPYGKIADTCFFFLSKLSPFLELFPFEKIKMESDAWHIL